MRKSIPLAAILTVLMVLSIGTAPVAAQPALSTSGSSTTAASGDTGVQVTFSVTNTGDENGTAQVTVDNSTLPSGWSVTALSATDPNPSDNFAVINNPPTYIFSDINPGETVTVTATVDVPSGASAGDYTLDATADSLDTGAQIGTPSSTITVSEGGPFSVSNLSPSAPTVGQGDQVSVSADITNDGNAAGDTQVRLRVDGTVQDTTTLQGIGAGASTTASFTFQAPQQTGTHDWSIETDDDSASSTFTVSEAGPFSIADTQLNPQVVSPGAALSVTVSITNQGSAAGSTTVQVSAPWGQTSSATTANIAAGATEQVTLALTASSTEAMHTLTVTTPDASQSVTVTVDTLAPYLDNQGNVGTSGLLDAIDDWRTDEIDTSRLITVINEWRADN